MSAKRKSTPLLPQLHVRVTLLAYHGRMLFKDNPKLREAYEGDLRVQEDRMHKHGRVVTVARLLGRQDGNEVVVLQLNDVVLLWIGDRKLRFRGFEYVGDTEYAQVWEAEVL